MLSSLRMHPGLLLRRAVVTAAAVVMRMSPVMDAAVAMVVRVARSRFRRQVPSPQQATERLALLRPALAVTAAMAAIPPVSVAVVAMAVKADTPAPSP